MNTAFPTVHTILTVFVVSTFSPILTFAAALAGEASLEPGLYWKTGASNNEPFSASGARLLETRYETEVSGLLAVTHLEQTFRNDTPVWQEAIYRFPLPDDAAVFGLEIHNGDEIILGQIEEKQRAEARYAAAKAEGIQAVLTQQDRPNLFTQKISAVAPGATVTLSLDFQQNISYSSGTYSLVLPTTYTPRYSPSDRDNEASESLPGQAFSADAHPRLEISVTLNDTLPIDRIESRGFNTEVNAGAKGTRVTLNESEATSDHDFRLDWETANYAEPGLIWAQESVDGSRFLQLMLEPPTSEEVQESLTKSQIWVMDTSGSMEGESLRQAKAALKQGLSQLNPGDSFNVIEFNDTPETLFATPVPATPDWLAVAFSRIDRLQAGGGTEILKALEEAFAQPTSGESLHQIIFVTDGSVGNEDAVLQQVALDRGSSRLFTVGIGSAPNRFMLRKAAELGQGSSLFIQSQDEVAEQIKRLADRLSHPVLTDLQLSLKGHPNIPVAFPSLGNDLYAGEPLMLIARLPSQTPSNAQLVLKARVVSQDESNTQSAVWERTLKLAEIPQHAGVARAWARQQVQLLEDMKTLGEDAEVVRKAVLDLALKHQLVSPYTSLIAVAQYPTRPANSPLHTSQVGNPMPRGWTTPGTGFQQTGTYAGTVRQWGLMIILSILLLRLKRQLLSTPTPWIHKGTR